MKQWLGWKVAPVACALMVAASLGTARSAMAKDARDNDPPRQEQQQEQQPQEQQELRLTATLVGVAPFNGAFGFAEFEREGARARLKLEVEHLNLPNGTLLNVLVNGSPLAGVTLMLIGGRATLVLDTANGQTVPVIGPGSTITVARASGAPVAQGQFS